MALMGTNFPRRYARFAYGTGLLTFFLDTAEQMHINEDQYGLSAHHCPFDGH